MRVRHARRIKPRQSALSYNGRTEELYVIEDTVLSQYQNKLKALLASNDAESMRGRFKLACSHGFSAVRPLFASQGSTVSALRHLLEQSKSRSTSIREFEKAHYLTCCRDLDSHLERHSRLPEYDQLEQECARILEVHERLEQEMAPVVDELWAKSITSKDKLKKMLDAYSEILAGRKRHGVFDHLTEQAERRVRFCQEALARMTQQS